MKRALVAAVLLFPATLSPAQSTPPPASTGSPHVMLGAAQMKWGDPPPVLPKGARFTVVSGDPGKEGLFCVRLKMPAGYKIPPHWHPTDEHVTVIAGTLSLGMGDTFDTAKTTSLAAGGYAVLPAEMRHYAWSKSGATVQIFGKGPFAITYVNPADDPSKAAAK